MEESRIFVPKLVDLRIPGAKAAMGEEWKKSRQSQHGKIPGGVSLRTGRQAVLFNIVNPMDNQDGLGKTL